MSFRLMGIVLRMPRGRHPGNSRMVRESRMEAKRLLVIGGLGLVATAGAEVLELTARPGDDLAKVRDAVRVERARGKDVRVMLGAGTYVLSAPLEFGLADSGTFRSPVVWRAAEPGRVRIRGGVTIRVADMRPVSDAVAKARFPESVRERIREADLAAAFPQPLPPWKDGFTDLPPEPWAYANGRVLPLARWPNEAAEGADGGMPVADGWSWITNAVDQGYAKPDANRGQPKRTWPGAFKLDLPRAARWKTDAGVWAFGYWTHDWHGEYLRLASYNPSNGVARFAAATAFGIACPAFAPPKRRFKVLNLPEELDVPGEWWFDRTRRRFYVLPAEDMEEIVLARSYPLIDVKAAKHLRFEGLRLEYTYGADTAAYVCREGSEDVVASRCTFTDHGYSGVKLAGQGNRVEDSVLARTGGPAAMLAGGSRLHLVNGRNALVRCDVSRWGEFTKASGVSVRGCGNAIRGCRLHEAPTSAIVYGGNEQLFADNEIFRVLLIDTDAGAVYTGYDASSQGNLLFGNSLHDIGDDPALARFRNGLYFDDCDWGDAAIGNVVVGTGFGAQLGGGSMHRLENNVFADCMRGVVLDTRAWVWKRNWRGSFSPDPKTGISWAESKVLPFNYRAAPWSVAYPSLPATIDNSPEIPRLNVVSNNVILRCGEPVSWPNVLGGKPLALAANEVITNADAAIPSPRRPIDFAAARETSLVSDDGAARMWIGLDVAGRLSWRFAEGGREVVKTSSLGVSVDGRDFGKLAIPGAAEFSAGEDVFAASNVFIRASRALKWEGALPRGWKGARIPLRDLVTGETVAFVEARIFAGGVAFRYRVPGCGRRFVAGEMTTWHFADREGVTLLEGERRADRLDVSGYPAAETQERGRNVVGVTFPERPRGFAVEGEVVTPWRITVCAKRH